MRPPRPEGPREAGDPTAVPRARAPTGDELELVEVQGGRHLLHRLAEMGLTRGARFRIVNRGRTGPVIISVKGARLMLGRGMVHRILVRPAGS